MTDFQRCQQAATAPLCPEKAADLLTQHHLELIHAAALALHRATSDERTAADLEAWEGAAERLAVALVARMESFEEVRHD
ncbi:hypothetical protein D3C78_1804760 [compost metagenome]